MGWGLRCGPNSWGVDILIRIGRATVLISLILTGYLVLPSYEEIDYLIGEMEYCIEIHEWYIENDYQREYTGSEEWHSRWIDTYNRTITVLVSYRSVLGLLSWGDFHIK